MGFVVRYRTTTCMISFASSFATSSFAIGGKWAKRVVDRDRTDSICSANRCSIYLDAMDPRFINFPGLCHEPCCVCYRHAHLSFSETYFMPPSFWCSHASKKKKEKCYSCYRSIQQHKPYLIYARLYLASRFSIIFLYASTFSSLVAL